MLRAIILLLACLLAGEGLHRIAGLPLPASVLGLMLLLGWLLLVPRERPELEQTSGWLMRHLSVMFVPAAVGIMAQGPVLARFGWALGLAIGVSTLVTMAVTALVFRWACQMCGSAGDEA